MNKNQHQPEILAFLQKTFSIRHWTFTFPEGSGHETYFALAEGRNLFIKLGAEPERINIMAEADLTPPVLANTRLGDGTSLVIQPYITGRKPTRKDFQEKLEQVASILRQLHYNLALKQVLPSASNQSYQEVAKQALARLKVHWTQYKPYVPKVADFVDKSLDYLGSQINYLKGEGLVASHNDICNANWLLTPKGRFYLVDLEAMSQEDPACDTGALLWWYYPPEQRRRFLEIAGYPDNAEFRRRMWLRMSMHCLSITLPRSQSFDCFDSDSYPSTLTDFRAILGGQENPQGY